MKPRILPLVMLVLLAATPCTSFAQRGMGGGGGRGGGRRGSGDGPGGGPQQLPASKDVDKLDPISMLMSNQKDLELNADVMAKLTNLDAELVQATRPALVAIDSIKAAIKQASDAGDAQEVMRDGMRAFTQNVEIVRNKNDDAGKKSLELMSGDQKKKAEKLLGDRRDEFDKLTRPRGGYSRQP